MSVLSPGKFGENIAEDVEVGKGSAPDVFIDIQRRANLRGLKRCEACGQINGQRALICKNPNCTLRQKILASQRPFDPIRLITFHNNATELFSVRSKERDVNTRNFVQTSEEILVTGSNAMVVSCNAICYLDTCKYGTTNAASATTCKHIKACSDRDNETRKIPVAEVYNVSRDAIFSLNIGVKQKQRLWEICAEDELVVPAVQRLSKTIFAVKCEQTKAFPAGRLHVIANNPNGKANAKKSPYSCACKKLKVTLQADNSLIMEEDVCEHVLLVLAAVLSHPTGKGLHSGFLNGLKTYWTFSDSEQRDSDPMQDDSFFGMDINIGDNFVEDSKPYIADDIFIFEDKFLTHDYIPDFSDIKLEPEMQMATSVIESKPTLSFDTVPLLLRSGDPNLVSSCNIAEIDEDIDIRFADATAAVAAVAAETKSVSSHITDVSQSIDLNIDTIDEQFEFNDCNIELMDQYQLTDRIDLCSDGSMIAELPNSNNHNSISFLSSVSTNSLTAVEEVTTSMSATPSLSFLTKMGSFVAAASAATSTSVTLPVAVAPTPSTTEKPATQTIELPTIAVVEKSPVKATDIVNAIKTRKLPVMPAKRGLIVNLPASSAKKQKLSNSNGSSQILPSNDGSPDASVEPALAFTTWLEHVIEIMNESVRMTDKTDIIHNFHVHEETFAHFCKTFSSGARMRMPNAVTTIKSGKYKGLTKYAWHFPNPATVRRIFSTKNLSVLLEQNFERNGDGSFVPYIQPTSAELVEMKRRRIYPKISLYMVNMCFDSKAPIQKNGLRVEWIADVLPRSHFGALSIQFFLECRLPSET